MKRIIISVLFGIVLLSSVSVTPAVGLKQNIILSTYNQESSVLRANHIIWKYKIMNGRLWKRKYDITARAWIGDWILAE